MDGGATEIAFLGVERSVSGRRWRERPADLRMAAAISEHHRLPEIVGRMLAQRGIDLVTAPWFLTPRLRDQLPDPSHLIDMDRAVARIVAAVERGERIVVFGDYDVDGATSAALLQRFFAAIGVAIGVYVPDRMREGYGPNAAALAKLKAEGAGLVITVDCGTTAHEALAAAAADGLDVIVIDHHVAEPLLPKAFAVVNPNRLDESSPYGNLAAIGLTYLLVVALNRALRAAGRYGEGAEPDLLQWLDLVALGTVCDVVPLNGLNRAFAAQGLRLARRTPNRGMAALASVAGMSGPIDAYQLGFGIGPRVNAGGRVGAADLGARLLATDDPDLAGDMARRLDEHNRERREIEAAALEQAIARVEGSPQSPALVFVAGEGWHPGVIGIVAARLKDRYNRPACVVAIDGAVDGAIGKGSGRSVPGVALGPAVIAARQEGLLINGGGHAMAAGFTVASGQVEALREFLAVRLGDGVDVSGLVPELSIDGALSAAAAQGRMMEHVDRLAPFGSANPEPRFAFPSVRIAHAEPVGTGHLRVNLADPLGGEQLRGIAFRVGDTPLGKFLAEMRGRAVHISGHLRRDTWRGGDAVQLQIDDAAPAD